MEFTSQAPYEELGGEAFFATLVEHFYQGVAEDPLLRPLYPEADLAPPATPAPDKPWLCSGALRWCTRPLGTPARTGLLVWRDRRAG